MTPEQRQTLTTYLKSETRPKYGNQPITIDNIPFQSKREAHRYAELRLMEKARDITALRLQVPFPLTVNNVTVAIYIADFVYITAAGKTIVEDVKSEPTKTPLYRLKKRLLRAIYGLTITET